MCTSWPKHHPQLPIFVLKRRIIKSTPLWVYVYSLIKKRFLNFYFYLQEKIMRVPYGPNHEFFKHSLFLVFCNRITTSAVSAVFLLVSDDSLFERLWANQIGITKKINIYSFIVQTSKKALDPVAPIYKYAVVSISNILTTTCQYEVRCSFHSHLFRSPINPFSLFCMNYVY